MFDWNEASINIPATFLPFKVMSFGHFTLVFKFVLLRIAFDNATDVTIGSSMESAIVNVGCKIIEHEIPPFEETHFLFNRPLPSVCF